MVHEFLEEQRLQIVTARQNSRNAPTAQQILANVGLKEPISTIKRLWCRYRKHRSLSNQRGRGRKRLTTKAQDEAFIKRVKRNRRKSYVQHAKETAALIGKAVSRTLISRRLKDCQYGRRVGIHRPALSEIQKQRRLAFANTY